MTHFPQASDNEPLSWPGRSWEADQFATVRLGMMIDRRSDPDLATALKTLGTAEALEMVEALEAAQDNFEWCAELLRSAAKRARRALDGLEPLPLRDGPPPQIEALCRALVAIEVGGIFGADDVGFERRAGVQTVGDDRTFVSWIRKAGRGEAPLWRLMEDQAEALERDLGRRGWAIVPSSGPSK